MPNSIVRTYKLGGRYLKLKGFEESLQVRIRLSYFLPAYHPN